MTSRVACDGLFRDPLPAGFSRRVVHVEPGLELDLDANREPDAVWVVEEGALELECRSGMRRRFGRGSMIPIERLAIVRLRNVGPGPLVLVAVSRAMPTGTDEFLRGPGSHIDC